MSDKKLIPGRKVRRMTRDGLQKFFDSFPDKVKCYRINGGILFRWSRKGCGNGELTMRVTRGKLEVDTECMGPDFCADVVKQAIAQSLRMEYHKTTNDMIMTQPELTGIAFQSHNQYQTRIKAIGGDNASDLTPDDIDSFSKAEKKIIDFMSDGKWHCDFTIVKASGQREGLRRLRTLRSKGWKVETQRVPGVNMRTYAYRLTREGGAK